MVSRVLRWVALALMVPLTAQAEWVGELHGATTGIGGTVGYRWSETLAARAGWQGFKLNDLEIDPRRDTNFQGVDPLDHEGDATLNVGHLLLDWYPRAGRFRITAGALVNLSSMDVTSRCTAPSGDFLNPAGDCEFGFSAFDNSELGEIKTDIEFNTLAPYVGIGWGHRANERWAVVADIGVAYTGAPKADMRSTGSCNNSAQCRQQIENEEKELEEELKNLKFYPVVSIGFSYRLAR